MNALGKIIGGAIGYPLGGVFGFLVGVLIGHLFDRGIAQVKGGYHFGSIPNTEVQEAFFEATFSVMGSMAKADGRVSEEEISLARQVMGRMGLTEQSRLQAIKLFNTGKQAGFPLEDTLTRFRDATHHAHNLRQMFIEIQLYGAYADGVLNSEEHKLLLHICDMLGFSSLDFERLDAMVRAEHHAARNGKGGVVDKVSPGDAYAILNIKSDADDKEVKRAYRRLMNQHHPDKLVAKGLPPEMMKLAEEKTHEIRMAYERVREARGI